MANFRTAKTEVNQRRSIKRRLSFLRGKTNIGNVNTTFIFKKILNSGLTSYPQRLRDFLTRSVQFGLLYQHYYYVEAIKTKPSIRFDAVNVKLNKITPF